MDKKVVRRLSYMGMDTVLTDITLYLDDTVEFTNYTDDIVDRAFGVLESPVTVKELNELMEERCFPETRGNRCEVVRALGLEFYEIYSIVEKTHGIMMDDIYWIRFEGEDLTYKEAVNKLYAM